MRTEGTNFGHRIYALARERGGRIYCDLWRYVDDNQPIEGNDRPCPRCGQMATPEGHDPCIANLPGVAYACCGHGTGKPYVKMEDDTVRHFKTTEELLRFVLRHNKKKGHEKG